jgi:hypothetical protein
VIRWHLAQAYDANGESSEAVAAVDSALEALEAQREAIRERGGDPKEEPEWAAEARAMRQRIQTSTASS